MAIKKFQQLFLNLLLLNRTTLLRKNLQFFSKYLSSLFKIKMHHHSFVNILHLVLVLQQNKGFDSFIEVNTGFDLSCSMSKHVSSDFTYHISKSRSFSFTFKVSKDSLYYLEKPSLYCSESFDFFFAILPVEESCDVSKVSNVLSFTADEYFYVEKITT